MMKSQYSPVRLTFRLLVWCALALPAFSQISVSGSAEGRQIVSGHLPNAVTTQRAFLVSRLPATQHLNLSLGVPLRDRAGLEAFVSDIYDPQSPNYRHFLTVDEFTQRFAPTQEDYQAVVDFAKANGLTVKDTPANRLIVDVEGSIDNIERAFQ